VGEVLIEIEQEDPRFKRFIGVWLCGEQETVLVDVGPASSASALVQELKERGVDRIDYILLTHIHLDHCGGLPAVMAAYPMARVICHQKAVPFLVNPSTLWEGSLKVLGKVAEMYGEPRGVPRERLISHTAWQGERIRVLETPGHAAHHLSFRYGDRLFVGEAAGTYHRLGGGEYLRPPTPPRFFFDTCVESVERLLREDDLPVFFAHFGRAESSHRILRWYRDQLFLWKEVIARITSEVSRNPEDACIEALLAEDPRLGPFSMMDPECRARERYFMKNSVRGFLGYLEGDGKPGR